MVYKIINIYKKKTKKNKDKVYVINTALNWPCIGLSNAH